MPGFATHYILGKNAASTLPSCTLKSAVINHWNLYMLGLQGPDIFFYYLPVSLHDDERNLGSVMHEQKINTFFKVAVQKLRTQKTPELQETSAAYVAGFLSHYLCDANIHPFVYSRIGYTRYQGHYLRHGHLEDNIDALLINDALHIKPRDFNASSYVCPTTEELTFLSQYLSEVINLTFYSEMQVYNFQFTPEMIYKAVTYFRLGLKLRDIPKIRTKNTPARLPNRVRNFNLNHDVWANPWDPSKTSSASFIELYLLAFTQTVNDDLLLDAILNPENKNRQAAVRKFLSTIGSRSYHSGLHVPE